MDEEHGIDRGRDVDQNDVDQRVVDQQSTSQQSAKSVLLTGGAGYIGSHTCVALLEAGHRVVVLDNLSNSFPEAVQRAATLGGGKTIDLHVGDVRDSDSLTQLLASESIDTVVHFAGLKSVGDSVSDPLSYYDVNTAGSISLLGAMDRAGVRRLVFSSSCTVYGDTGGSPEAQGPINPYGRSKSMVEQVLTDLAATDNGWEIMSLRYFNPAGAHPAGCIGEHSRQQPTNLMPVVMAAALNPTGPITIFGDDYNTPDGTCIRDYVHVADLAEGHVRALEQLTPGIEFFNLGTGRGVSVSELLAAARRVTGRAIPAAVGPRRAGDAAIAVANVDGTTERLGWLARRGLDLMCEDHWRWLRLNPRGYER